MHWQKRQRQIAPWFLAVLVLLATGCGGMGGSGSYTIMGTIVDSAGNPMPHIAVYINGSEPLIAGSDGSFALGGLSGSLTFEPRLPGHMFVPRVTTVSSQNHALSFTGLRRQNATAHQTRTSADYTAFDTDVVVDWSQSNAMPYDWVKAPRTTAAPLTSEMTALGSMVELSLSRRLTGGNYIRLGFAAASSDQSSNATGQGTAVMVWDSEQEHWQSLPTEQRQGYWWANVTESNIFALVQAPIAAQPTVEPQPGVITAGSSVTLEAAANARIYYTTDGSRPTDASSNGIGSVTLTIAESTEIRAFVQLPNHVSSVEARFVYVTQEPTYISGPHLGQIVGYRGGYSFDSGQAINDAAEADLSLAGIVSGAEHTLSVNGFQGKVFPRSGDLTDWHDPFQVFRDVSAADWEITEDPNAPGISAGDTILLRTRAGQFVKVAILSYDWTYAAGTAVPTLNFAYKNLDERDHAVPQLENIRLEVGNLVLPADMTTQPGRWIFTVSRSNWDSGDSMRLLWNFNEPVIPGVGNSFKLDEATDAFELRTAGGWTVQPAADQLQMVVSPRSHLDTHTLLPDLSAASFFAADLVGNALTELPFAELVIVFE